MYSYQHRSVHTVIVIGGLKVHGFDKTNIQLCRYYKDLHYTDPNYHRLSIPRDVHTFPISQSKLETALFVAIFSFALIVPVMNTLLRQDEAKIRLNLYTPVETSPCATHSVIPQSP
jgi:hypothetical protein